MNCLLDNDLIRKLAICDLLDESLKALHSSDAEAHVLPTARYVLLKPIKKPEKAKERLGDALFERLDAFFKRVRSLDQQPSATEQLAFDDVVGIDPGEAVLFSATDRFQDFLLATGDKNSLRALVSTPACDAICRRLNGKVVCFEQVILRIIDGIGFDAARAKIVPGADCDIALRAVFGSGLEATESNVRAGLDSYIADLRKATASLLIS
jgi:hypothetical protein